MKTKMTIDNMINSLLAMRDVVGGDEVVPTVMIGYGENDYFIPDYPVVGDFEDQDGNKYKCAFISGSGGEEFTKVDVPHYNWDPSNEKIEPKKPNFDGYIHIDEKDANKFPKPTIVDMSNVLHVKLEHPYMEDSEVNGIEDDDVNPRIPGYNGNSINWDIDIDTGKILNWNKGTTAKTWYKICDEFSYYYRDFHYGPDYVPDFISIDDHGYGDYVYLTIDENGMIKNWSKEKFLKENVELQTIDNES